VPLTNLPGPWSHSFRFVSSQVTFSALMPTNSYSQARCRSCGEDSGQRRSDLVFTRLDRMAGGAVGEDFFAARLASVRCQRTRIRGDAGGRSKKVFAHCAPCHSIKPGENKVGPSLAGVFGRKSGTEPDYSYSSAIKALNVTWDETNLNEWLQGPGKFVKGTKMIYSVRTRKIGRTLSLSEDVVEIIVWEP